MHIQRNKGVFSRSVLYKPTIYIYITHNRLKFLIKYQIMYYTRVRMKCVQDKKCNFSVTTKFSLVYVSAALLYNTDTYTCTLAGWSE